MVQPDLFVAELGAYIHSGMWSDIQVLYLTIEILSPSSVRADRFTKRRLYQEQRIAEYWIVDIEHQQVEAWTPDAIHPAVERERLLWRHPSLDVACRIDLPALFARG